MHCKKQLYHTSQPLERNTTKKESLNLQNDEINVLMLMVTTCKNRHQYAVFVDFIKDSYNKYVDVI